MDRTVLNRLKFIAILALFIGPLLAAVLMYKGIMPVPGGGHTSNQGKLITPPVALDWSAARFLDSGISPETLKHRWVILFDLEMPCQELCISKVSGLRQVHRASGRNQDRIELVLVSPQNMDTQTRQELLTIYDQFVLAEDPGAAIQSAIASVRSQSGIPDDVPTSYLVDPLGNIMMAYNTADSDSRMSKDLKKLLTWSKQDK